LKNDKENFYKNFSHDSITSNLDEQDYTLDDLHKGSLIQVLTYLNIDIKDLCSPDDLYLHDEIYEDFFYELVAQENNIRLNIHTNSIENPIKSYNISNAKIINIYKYQKGHYYPIISKILNNIEINPIIKRQININIDDTFQKLFTTKSDITDIIINSVFKYCTTNHIDKNYNDKNYTIKHIWEKFIITDLYKSYMLNKVCFQQVLSEWTDCIKYIKYNNLHITQSKTESIECKDCKKLIIKQYYSKHIKTKKHLNNLALSLTPIKLPIIN
jgi:hypothetical protein